MTARVYDVVDDGQREDVIYLMDRNFEDNLVQSTSPCGPDIYEVWSSVIIANVESKKGSRLTVIGDCNTSKHYLKLECILGVKLELNEGASLFLN
jgi:hypothetical protein|tara:strand:- start:178 stop:462 length:285 start_codon:yes stop_codon:yes gene_type:complete